MIKKLMLDNTFLDLQMFVFFIIQIHTGLLKQFIRKIMIYFLRIFFLVLVVNFLTWSSGEESLTFAQEKALKKNR
jgi:hypothetical protein